MHTSTHRVQILYKITKKSLCSSLREVARTKNTNKQTKTHSTDRLIRKQQVAWGITNIVLLILCGQCYLPPKSITMYLVPGLETPNPFEAPSSFSKGRCWQNREAASGSKAIRNILSGKPAYNKIFMVTKRSAISCLAVQPIIFIVTLYSN